MKLMLLEIPLKLKITTTKFYIDLDFSFMLPEIRWNWHKVMNIIATRMSQLSHFRHKKKCWHSSVSFQSNSLIRTLCSTNVINMVVEMLLSTTRNRLNTSILKQLRT